MQIKSAHCGDCGDQRKVERKTPNHILHLLLSVITGGLWIIIWILASLSRQPWRCSVCGSTRVGNGTTFAKSAAEGFKEPVRFFHVFIVFICFILSAMLIYAMMG